jgi:hypothetical protein
MGRRKKQADIEEVIVESEQTEARKNSELTADERRALHFRHCAEYERALQVKKLADAGLKNVGKRIKAESDSVAKCKQTIQARTPQGEAELRAEIEQTLEVLRWSGVAVGETAEMFADRRPADEKAYEEGKMAGLRGETCKPPHDPATPAAQEWIRGHGAGQSILMESFQKVPVEEEPATEVIPAPATELEHAAA